ncbi:MAG TPA: pitrilysin family protein [bacterium]|nr:pitrilysin family protein [bacterium]
MIFRAIVLVLCLWPAMAFAQDASSAFNLPVVEKVLQNGLTVLVVERPGVPVVSFAFLQPVGAQDAPKGKTGLPHMLEHMMFKGTQTIGTKSYAKEKPILDAMDRVALAQNAEKAKDNPDPAKLRALGLEMRKLQDEQHQVGVNNELSNIYTLNGGQSLNAWTSQDCTAYTVTLPADKVAVYAQIEKDRISHPVFREFYTERDVVAQERRWRTESSPEGKLYETLQSAAYSAAPYRDPSIGWMSDIQKLTRMDAESFYNQTYRPDRGVLAVVGGVKAADVLAIFEKTLGTVPNPKVAPLKPDWTKEPPQDGERVVRTTFDSDPMAMMAWHKPNFPKPDSVALDVLCSILTSGNTSRLVKDLIFTRKMAHSVSASTGFPGDRDPDLLVLQYEPAPPYSSEQVGEAIDADLADLKAKGVSEDELNRAKRGAESSFLWGKTSTMGLAEDLAYNQAVHGDWSYSVKYLDMVRALTASDIQQAAQKYLVDKNRTIAYLERDSQ